MKEVIVHPTPTFHTTIHNVDLPTPAPTELVIKVMVAGTNPKDWSHPIARNIAVNSGDDFSGIVHALGSDVVKTREFNIGDTVAAFHPMLTPHGAFAEYAVAPAATVFKLPAGLGLEGLLTLFMLISQCYFGRSTDAFEEAATIPLVITTSAISLFRRQHLPPPWSPRTSSSPPIPLIVYGASSAVGTFAVKLARASNIHPIIAIAGSSSSHLNPLLDESKGDTLIDYKVGIENMKYAVQAKLNGLPCHHAVDSISANGTWIPLSQMLTPSTETQTSYLSVFYGGNEYDEHDILEGVKIVYTYVGTVHDGAYRPGMVKQDEDTEFVKGDPEWTYVFFRYIARMLADGRLTGHPWEVIEGGLEGVEKGLTMLKEGKAKGVKFVYRVANI